MKEKRNCDFCGEPLENNEYLESGSLCICGHCWKKGFHILFDNKKSLGEREIHAEKNKASILLPDNFTVMKPQDIYKELNKYVIGQDLLCRSLSVWGYRHQKRLKMVAEGVPVDDLPKKSAMLMIGPTGVGKTLSFTKLAAILDLPSVIIDVTSITEAGYVGEDVQDILKRLLESVDGNTSIAATGIVFLDEFDKLANNDYRHHVGKTGAQQSLLKLIENGTININANSKSQSEKAKTILLSTEHIGFVAAGAFSGMKKDVSQEKKQIGFRCFNASTSDSEIMNSLFGDVDLNHCLVKYGLIPEIVGRFDTKCILNGFSKDDLKDVLREGGILKAKIKEFEDEGVDLKITEECTDMIAHRAFEKGMGARSLMEDLNKLTNDLSFKYFGQQCVNKTVVIDVDANGKAVIDEQSEKVVVPALSMGSSSND